MITTLILSKIVKLPYRPMCSQLAIQ